MFSSPYTSHKRIEIVLACLRSTNIKNLCKKHKITQQTYYNWKKEFLRGAKIHLANAYSSTNDPFIKAYRQQILSEQLLIQKKLERENSRLKKYIALIGEVPRQLSYSTNEKARLIRQVDNSLLPKTKAAKLLGTTNNTILVWKKQERAGILRRRAIAKTKCHSTFYIEHVFALLHEPPAKYGFHRTNWRLRDLHKVLIRKRVNIGLGTIIKIIKNAGYKYRHAKVVLTSNDPQYRAKVVKLKKVLRSLKQNELFFSIDEYGPFTIKMQGGRSWTAPGVRKHISGIKKTKV